MESAGSSLWVREYYFRTNRPWATGTVDSTRIKVSMSRTYEEWSYASETEQAYTIITGKIYL